MVTGVDRVRPVRLEDEMRSSYLDYAMSVIVSRALPDVRDGLKPVQRRILYALFDLGLRPTGPHKKSARIVGEVLGKYHPHGDAAVYDAMVRLAQDFSLRYPLVDGQGNFGSLDNDPPAAMRYTEARLTSIAEEMLADIDKDTVDFIPNFDGSLNEPTVLPGKLPNLLLNGAAGIAVGMATNIPPHNLGELCDAIIHLIDNPEATIDDLLELVPGPDFPTGGVIRGREGIKLAYTTGHGRIVVEARATLEESTRTGKHQIVVTELPYLTNKAALVERIAELAREKRVEGIAEVRDESDREGMRIVIELRREDLATQVLNNLRKHTALRSAFNANMLALVDRQPKVVTLKTALGHYIDFRRQVIARRSRFELARARERAHILEGLKTALSHLDQVIATIRQSETTESARNNLMRAFELTQVQAQAILDMQLRRLAALERKKIDDEYAELVKTIAYLEDLLANPRKIDFLIQEDARQLKERHGDPRRTQISDEEAADFSAEDLIAHRQTVVTLSQRGYIKRILSETYRTQRRGGKGATGMRTREADIVQHLLITDTHDNILFFTNRGKVFRLRCHEIPQESSRQARGMPIVNLISIEPGEQVTAVVAVPRLSENEFMIMVTRQGEVKKTPLSDFAIVRSNGLIAMDLESSDELVAVALAKKDDDVLMATQGGKAIRFAVSQLRTASRTSGGVRGIRLGAGDKVLGMGVVSPAAFLLTITTNGFGKRTGLEEFPRHGRGGGGVVAHKLNEKTGTLAAATVVEASDHVMIISAEGIVIRTQVKGISSQGRAAQGVTVMDVAPNDRVASISCCTVE